MDPNAFEERRWQNTPSGHHDHIVFDRVELTGVLKLNLFYIDSLNGGL
jgi:hypothetical protein